MFKQYLKSVLPPLAILLSFFIGSQVQAAVCTHNGSIWMGWGNSDWLCGASQRAITPADDAYLGEPGAPVTFTLDQDVTQLSLELYNIATLNAGSYTLNLTGATPIRFDGTFNAGTSTVRLSDSDVLIEGSFGTVIYNNLVMGTLTAPRTVTLGSSALKTVIQVNGDFISGSSASAMVSFVKGDVGSNVANSVTSYYCASNGGITNINCVSPGYGSTPGPGTLLTLSGTLGTYPGPSTTLTVRETGTQQLDITSLSITGTDGNKFFPIGSFSFSIPDGATDKTISVGCDSSSAGTFTATLEVGHNATGSPATYPLSCTISSSGSSGSSPKSNQTINFSPPATVTVGQTVTLTATAASGLPVTLTGGPSDVCTVTGTTLTAVSAGTCTVTADQAGDANYNAAPQVSQNITINAGGQVTVTPSTPPLKENVTVTPSTPPLPDYLGLFLQVDGRGQGQVTTNTGLSCQSSDCQVDPKTGDLKCNQQNCTQAEKTASYVTLTPQADADSVFSSWGGHEDCVDGQVFMNSGKLCIAFFRRIYSLTVATQGPGQVTGSGDSNQQPLMECGTTCQTSVSEGMRVSLQATPSQGMTFSGWSGDCGNSTQTSLAVEVTKEKKCLATFAAPAPPKSENLDSSVVPTTPVVTTPVVTTPHPRRPRTRYQPTRRHRCQRPGPNLKSWTPSRSR